MDMERPHEPTDPRERLRARLERAAHLLPVQGPIGVFVHHNTLHAFQQLPFEQAVAEAARLFGAEPFLSEERYRAERARGRIGEPALEAELERELTRAGGDEPLAPGLRAGRLWRALLAAPVDDVEGPALRWLLRHEGRSSRLRPDLPGDTRQRLVARTRAWLDGAIGRGELRQLGDALRGEPEPWVILRLASRALGRPLEAEDLGDVVWRDPEALAAPCLWNACRRRVGRRGRAWPEPASRLAGVRHRERLLELGAEDSDDLVNPLLVRWCGAFLDQGVAYWPLPSRARGLYRSWRELLLGPGTLPEPFLRGLRGRLRAQADRDASAEEVVLEALAALGVPDGAQEAYIEASLLALPGWAGMVRVLEQHPELAPHEAPPAALVDLLAVRLLLEQCALEHLAAALGLAAVPPPAGPSAGEAPGEGLAFVLFQVAQLAGIAAPDLLAWSDAELERVLAAVRAFHPLRRRALWHRAYERHHRDDVLAGIVAHRRRLADRRPPPPPSLQAVFCIDEREESIRRHLEEQDARYETLGAGGFFGLAIEYRGLDDAHAAPLCPVVARPEHEVRERPRAGEEVAGARRLRRRRLLGALGHGAYLGSRTLLRGLLAAAGLGLLSAFPLLLHILSPRRAAAVRRWLHDAVAPQPRTELTALRDGDGPPAGEKPRGFTVEEAAARIGRLLQDSGLAGRLAPLVAVIGHGSRSLNNPHESAHDCGACGGRHGAANARLFASLANDPRVRAALAAAGVEVPAGTWFVGGFHDTCNDEVVWFDLDRTPTSHRDRLAGLRGAIDRARALSAHERCRRFEAAPPGITPEEALRHVEDRAEHLAEPRPEYGHCTNAVCIFGRRAWSRGLFLDRRAFLISYDPARDREAEALTRLLGAMGPVGAGISLEYYFSFVDNERYGCGTKLPHNITGLIGVMNGHQGDLRTGLPWQMVELHEPVRLLTIVEATPEALLQVAGRNAEVAELVTNGWLQLVSVDPADGRLHLFEDGRFVPYAPPERPVPRFARSTDYYRGHREHLSPATIEAGLEAA